MPSSIKNPTEQDGQSKPGTSPRSNPVCLEIGVTLRSLPGEANSQTQPIREDLKTVIVFDNGAVLRSSNNLPGGMTLILSNASARDVVCRVVTGRSMPSVKGYVEVEFMEPVKDFWGIHTDGAPTAAPSQVPAAPPALKVPTPTLPAAVRPEAQKTPSSAPSGATPPAAPVFTLPARPELAAPSKPTPPRPEPVFSPPSIEASETLSATQEFDEFPTPFNSMPASSVRTEPKSPPIAAPAAPWASPKSPSVAEKPATEYSHFDSAGTTSVANWTPPTPEPPAAKQTLPAAPETVSAVSLSPVPARDFMSQGLMAYEKPDDAASTPGGQKNFMLAAAAVVLAAISGAAFFMMHQGGSAPVAKAAIASPPVASKPAATQNPPAAAPLAPAQTAQHSAPPVPQSEAQPQAHTVAAEQIQPSEAVAPIPLAEIANSSNSDTQADSHNSRRQDKTAAAKQPEASAPKRPKIANLKMAAPAAPVKNLGDGGDNSAPVTEIASANMPVESAPTALLGSSGRPAGAPVAPPPPPAAKVVTDPKLISSTRAVYPQAAKQANIEGSVTVMAYIDQTGKVSSARSLTGPVMLRAAAEESVKQWKYSPGLEDGKPVQSKLLVRVDFKLN